MSKKKQVDVVEASFNKLYTNDGVVNLGKVPRYPVKVRTNRPSIDYVTDGGLPKGRLILVAAEKSSGKSSLVIQVAGIFGPKILYCDTEATLTTDYIESLGADPFNFDHYIPLTTEKLCDKIRAKIADYDVVVIDSINNSASNEQMQKEAGDKTMANRALVMSAQLPIIIGMANQTGTPVIVLSQVRSNMNKANKFSPDTVVPGGFSLHHNSSMTLEMYSSTKQKQSKTDDDVLSNKSEIIGGKMVRIKCTKNKVGVPDREVSIEFTYNKGFTVFNDVIAAAIEFGIIAKKGAWFSYNDTNIGNGMVKTKAYLKEHPDLFDEIALSVDISLNEILNKK